MNPNALQALQEWYFAQCDGDWEHSFGVSNTTLDNPGWSLNITLTGTELQSQTFEPVQRLEHETEWVACKRTDTQFQGRGGPLMLDELIGIFLRWAERSSPQQHDTMSELLPGYHTVRGGDVDRHGMYLELIDESTGDEVAEVFYSDATQKMTVSVFQQELPLHVVESLIERAKHDLPPAPK